MKISIAVNMINLLHALLFFFNPRRIARLCKFQFVVIACTLPVGVLGLVLSLVFGATTTLKAQNADPVFVSVPVTSIDEDDYYHYQVVASDEDLEGVATTAPTLPSWVNFYPGDSVITLAGGTASGSVDGQGASASFYGALGLGLDAQGNIYVADTYNNKIRKITPDGQVSTFAGTGAVGSADGPIASATFYNPSAVVVGPSGTVYVLDYSNHTIRKITPEGEVSTLAGSPGLTGSSDGTGSAARFTFPRAMAVDMSETLYVLSNNKVRKVDATGVVTTLAGSGIAGSTDGSGTAASFYNPSGVAVDANGTVYVADRSNHLIRKVTPAGDVTTIAGTGSLGFADGLGTAASFFLPEGIAVDHSGNIYVGDRSYRVRKISASGMVRSLAGQSRISGYTDGVGIQARFRAPSAMTLGADGILYVADGHRVRRMNANIILHGDPVGHAGNHAILLNASDGNGGSTDQSFAVTVNDTYAPVISSLTPINGEPEQATSFSFSLSFNENISPGTGSIYVIRTSDSTLFTSIDVSSLTITGTTASGMISGLDELVQYSIIIPDGAILDLAGHAFQGLLTKNDWTFTTENPAPVVTSIARFNPVAEVSSIEPETFTFRITFSEGVQNFDIDDLEIVDGGSPGIIQSLNSISASVFDVNITNVTGYGTLAIAFKSSHDIEDLAGVPFTGEINATESYTIENASPLITSTPITDLEEDVYYRYDITTSDVDGDAIDLTASVLPTWLTLSHAEVTTFAGSGQYGNENGPKESASFQSPAGLAVDANGNIFIADAGSQLIRKITPDGEVTTFAGSGTAGSADGQGTAATFSTPYDVAVDAAGNVYVADFDNHLIRKISPTGLVSTLAGTGSPGYENGQGTEASFNLPAGIVVDAAGNLFVADQTNAVIRKITPSGMVSTFAGTVCCGYSDGPGSSASFQEPQRIAIDASGNLYVQSSHSIRRIDPSGYVTTLAGSGTPGDADGQGSAASFSLPRGLVVDDKGNVYVSDLNHKIRVIAPSGEVTTIAGTGEPGANDDFGSSATFQSPNGLALDAEGNLLVSDLGNHKIRKIKVQDILHGYPFGSVGTHPVVLTATDDEGASAEQPFNITVHDGSPVVTDTYPISGSSGVNKDTTFSISFNKAVRAGAGSIYVVRTADSTVVETIPVDPGLTFGSDSTIFKAFDLEENDSYAVIIPDSAILNIAGNRFKGLLNKSAWTFTTGDFAPVVSRVFPEDNQAEVLTDTSLYIIFNQGVTAGTGHIYLVRSADSSFVQSFDVTTSVIFNEDTVSFTPDLLEEKVSYSVIIPGDAIVDVTGHKFKGIETVSSWNFTTGDFTAPSGYAVTVDQPFVNIQNESNISFTITGTEPGATYHYNLTDGSVIVSGSGTISGTWENVTAIDAIEFDDNTLTLELYLVDSVDNVGAIKSAQFFKDTRSPGTFTGTSIYGTTNLGGLSNNGTLYRYDLTNKKYNKLHDFDGANGRNPMASLQMGNEGKLYGLTYEGGDDDDGVLFSYNLKSNTFAKLFDFSYETGRMSVGSLTLASDGKFYGTLSSGVLLAGSRSNRGALFSYDLLNDEFATVHKFGEEPALNGYAPNASLTSGSDGKLWGTTNSVIFSFDPVTLTCQGEYSFQNSDGTQPRSLIQGTDGNFYGVTRTGGANNLGVLYSFNPSDGVLERLVDFDGTNGRYPSGDLAFGPDGKIYAMAVGGGPSNYGLIFSYDIPSSTYTVLKIFNGMDGRSPRGGLHLSSDGETFYGVTRQGGQFEGGVIFTFSTADHSYNVIHEFNLTEGGHYPLKDNLFLIEQPVVGPQYFPATGSEDVAVDMPLSIKFSENVTKEIGSIDIYLSEDNTLVESIAVGDPSVVVTGDSVSVTPGLLMEGTGYYVLVNGGAFGDAADNPSVAISGVNEWYFTTVSIPRTISIETNTEAEEDDTHGLFNVSISQPFTRDVTVNFTVSGSATEGVDYNALGTSIVFPANQSSVTIPVELIADDLVEDDETVTITHTGTDHDDVTIATSGSATVTITDDDLAGLSIVATTQASEDDTDGLFTITTSKLFDADVTVNFTVTGSATEGADYNALGTSIVFPANQSSVTIPVELIADDIVEDDETVIITLTGTDHDDVTIATSGSATVTITDDDLAGLSIVATTQASEDDTDGLFTITTSKLFDTDVTVNFTVSGSATEGADYNALGTSVVFPANQSSVAIPVELIADDLVENDETVIITLTGTDDSDVTIATSGVATVTITDDDLAGLSIVATTQPSEADADGLFTITTSKPFDTDVTVNFTVSGSATEGVDYNVLGTSVVFPANQSSVTIPVELIADDLLENDETVIITLTGTDDSDVTVAASGTATVTIQDDDELPQPPSELSIEVTTHAVEDDTDGLFTINTSEIFDTDVTVNFTVSGSATEGVDYNALGTSVVFPANQSSVTIPVELIADDLVEGDETVTITLTGTDDSDVTIATSGTATVTIQDNDALPQQPSELSIEITTHAAEDNTNGLFTLSTSLLFDTDVTVSFTVSGSATEGVDYNALGTSIVFPANQSSITIPVELIADDLVEDDETVIITLTGTDHDDVTIAASGSATVTIQDDDELPQQPLELSIEVTTHAAEDNTNGLFTLSTSILFDTDVTVNFTVSGSATEGADYNALGTSVVFPANQSSVTIPVEVIADEFDEEDENIILVLTSTSNEGVFPAASPGDRAEMIVTDNDISGSLFLPTLFTPNGDHQNETFSIKGEADVSEITLTIFDRDGKTVFQSSDWSLIHSVGWDGTRDNIRQPQGVYIWVVNGIDSRGMRLTINDGHQTGLITLLR